MPLSSFYIRPFIVLAAALLLVSGLAAEDSTSDRRSEDARLREDIEEIKRRLEEQEKRISELEEAGGLRISGFFDVNISNYENKPNIFEVGHLELDLEHTYRDRFQVAAAIVFRDGADLTVGFIDYHFFGGTIAPRGRLFNQNGLHIQIGKFDVPFGNDWQYFSSVNRIEINPPLTTFKLMDGGYNDVGIRFLGNYSSFNLSLYVLRGIESGYSYGGNSFGGRFGFTPFSDPFSLKQREVSPLEAGFSMIYDLDAAGSISEKLWSLDVEGKWKFLNVRAEYYSRDKLVGILLTGYQVSMYFDLDRTVFALPLVLYVRYDEYTSERYETIEEKNSVSRGGFGFNVSISKKIACLKFEYLHYFTTYDEFIEEEYFNRNQFYLQFLIRF